MGRPRVSAPSTSFVSVPVIATLDETPTIKTIRVARPDHFEFEPGQFLTVRTRIDGKEFARCYSLSSAPEARGYLEISVRRQGVVSNALHATARPGSMLSIKGPLGVFKYPAADDRPLVLLAGGIGITPLVSMLRHAVLTAPSRPITLLYSARNEEDFAFLDELHSIARRHPQVAMHFAVSAGASNARFYSGHIDETLIRGTVRHLTDAICLICGPAPMIEAMRALLHAMQVPAGQVRHEVFNAAVAASSSRDPESEVVAPPARTRTARRPAVEAAESHRMDCHESGKEVVVEAGESLLEAAERANVAVLSLCRAGVCGTCRVRVLQGEVDCASDALPASDAEQGFVLACVSTAKSDCMVEI